MLMILRVKVGPLGMQLFSIFSEYPSHCRMVVKFHRHPLGDGNLMTS